MKCLPGLTVRRLYGYSERKIDIYSFAKCRTRAADGKRRKTAEIRVAAGPDCEVGVKRYAYCRRKLLFALTFQRRRGEQVCSWPVSDEFGIKIVWFFEGDRESSNRIIHTGWRFL